MISDQQAALFGYDCRAPGQAACTHGTASFVNVVAGYTAPPPGRTKTYLAWELDGVPTYSLEADTTVTGAVIRWMQEQIVPLGDGATVTVRDSSAGSPSRRVAAGSGSSRRT